MNFIDDVDLEASAAWRIQSALKQFPHIVDLGIRCRIQFDQIDKASAIDFPACTAFAAWRCCNSISAIQRLGKNSCDCGLSDPAGTSKQIGMMQTVLCKSIAQCADHMILPSKFREIFGAPFARENRGFRQESHPIDNDTQNEPG